MKLVPCLLAVVALSISSCSTVKWPWAKKAADPAPYDPYGQQYANQQQPYAYGQVQQQQNYGYAPYNTEGETAQTYPADGGYSEPAYDDAPKKSSSKRSGGKTYTVKRGDTLYAISRRQGATVNEIKRANGLTSDRIMVGEKLTIP